MDTAPHKVLLLGWDAPAGAPPAVTVLATALAPASQPTLLLPHLSEPLVLPAEATATDLSQLSPAALDQLTPVWSVSELASWQAPAAPYLGATPADAGSSTSQAAFGVPAAPYLGRDESQAYLLDVGVEEAALLAEPNHEATLAPPVAADIAEHRPLASDDAAAASEPDAEDAGPVLHLLDDDTPPDALDVTREPEPAVSLPAAEAAAPPISVQHRVLEVALSAMRSEAADSAALNFRVIQYARLATRLAASQDFAVIYAADWQAWLAGIEIRQLTGRPLVLQVESLPPDRATTADRGWVLALERLALRRADLVLAATPELAARLTELYQLPPQRVLLLPGGQPAGSLTHTILAALGLG